MPPCKLLIDVAVVNIHCTVYHIQVYTCTLGILVLNTALMYIKLHFYSNNHEMSRKYNQKQDKNLTGFKNTASQIQSSNSVICALVVMVIE